MSTIENDADLAWSSWKEGNRAPWVERALASHYSALRVQLAEACSGRTLSCVCGGKGTKEYAELEKTIASQDWNIRRNVELEKELAALREKKVPEMGEMESTLLEIVTKWVPALLRDANEADKTNCNAHSIRALIIRTLPGRNLP